MRITTRLGLISFVSAGVLVAMAVAVLGSGLAFRKARNDYALANEIKIGVMECQSCPYPYFLHREVRLQEQWFLHEAAAEALLGKASARLRAGADHAGLERLHLGAPGGNGKGR